MENISRTIVCTNYKELADPSKGQALALFEKNLQDNRYYKINERSFFCDDEDMEVHITGNKINENDYQILSEKYQDKLYEVTTVEVKYAEDSTKLSKNKSNLHKLDLIEPRSVCEVIKYALPDGEHPEITINNKPLTRHIFIRDNESTFGPFEYTVTTNENTGTDEKYTLTLKKPSNTKYLGIDRRPLSIFKFNNDELANNYTEINYSKKFIDNIQFNRQFLLNVYELKDLEIVTINYYFSEELEKAISTIIKETNTRGISTGQVQLLSQRIKNRRHNFKFDTNYVLSKINETNKFDKLINKLQGDVRDIIIEQALNDNEELITHIKNYLRKDPKIQEEVESRIQGQLTDLRAELVELKFKKDESEKQLDDVRTKIAIAKEAVKKIDEDKENQIIEELKEKQTALNMEVESLETKRNALIEEYSDIFKVHSMTETLQKLDDEIKTQTTIYDSKVRDVNTKEDEIKKQQDELAKLTIKYAEDYKKELLSVKNSIDVLTQVNIPKKLHSFIEVSKKDLIEVESPRDLTDYIKFIQLTLSDYDRNMSIEQLINLLTCIDLSFITILSGLPGTGKTSLITILNEHVLKSRFNNIQVGRGWTSDRDFLGYFNPITNSFVSSDTGMFDYIINMERDDRINVVLLDEANLSPIEHYWSKFMGLTDKYEGKEFYFSNSKSVLLRNNLRFIATINNDMTTEPLSPRLLDRAPCIRLDAFNQFDDGNKSALDFIDETESNIIRNKFSDAATSYDSFKKSLQNCLIENNELENFADIVEQIKIVLTSTGTNEINYGSRVHLSERRFQTIKKYLHQSISLYSKFKENAVDWIELDKSFYFLDFAIAQYILPLINGHGKNFKNRIDALQKLLLSIEQKHRYELPISNELISRMICQGSDELDTYDFMSMR